MFVEVKRKGATVPDHQAITYAILDAALKRVNGQRLRIQTKNRRFSVLVKYYGAHVLTFENTTFEDGAVYFDGQRVTADQLAQIFAMDESAAAFFLPAK